MTEQMGSRVVTGAPGSSKAMKLGEQPCVWKQVPEDEHMITSSLVYFLMPQSWTLLEPLRQRNSFWYDWCYCFQEENTVDRDFSLRSRCGTPLMSGLVGECLQFPRNQHGSFPPVLFCYLSLCFTEKQTKNKKQKTPARLYK